MVLGVDGVVSIWLCIHDSEGESVVSCDCIRHGIREWVCTRWAYSDRHERAYVELQWGWQHSRFVIVIGTFFASTRR